MMTAKLKIDVVSDVVCPWCAVGVASLDRTLAALAGEVEAELAFHPFELNPDLPPGGENGLEHVALKYGISLDRVRANRAIIAERAAAVGFTMNVSDESRIVNTFDAHRLIAWASERGRGGDMERRLLALHFTEGRDVSEWVVLAAAAVTVGLDEAEALAMLRSDAHAEQVRREESVWRGRGIDSVPAVVVDGRYLISGGQLPKEFERQLRLIVDARSEHGDD